ncbi:hypothetical protein Pfo_000827 [Paulownia fortunei]|nr:hypothetical protein Pfo_000827 [Paulownia fortunei]
MSLYDANKNRGYKTYVRTEPVYGGAAYPDHVPLRPLIVGSEGREHAIVGYSATHNLQSYVTTTEQVVELRRAPATADYKHSPKRMELYKDHGVGDKPLAPWSSARGLPEKADGFSPKVQNQVVYSQSKGSPRNNVYRDHSPPSGDHYYSTYDYGKHDNLSSDDEDDDIICKDGVCYKIVKVGAKPNHLKEEGYDQEKHKGNGYAPPAYTVPPSTQPRKDSYYETSYTDNNGKYKGNGYVPPYYETSNNRPMVNTPAPIKTRNAPSRGVEFLNENTKNSPVSVAAQKPQLIASPRKDQGYQETIDSAEARRRYGRASSRAGAYGQEKYTRIIDSREAARKYNGVFVTN